VTRQLPDFISAFSEYAQSYNAPPRFSEWAGIFALSLAAGRNIGFASRGGITYANLYLQLIGPPATGKSRSLLALRKIIGKATDYLPMPAHLTRAYLEDYMKENTVMRKTIDGLDKLSSECIGMAEELQGILPDQDLTHLTMYNLLYDLPDNHVTGTRSHGKIELHNTFCALLTGAQPSFLSTVMPEQSWGMGFMSRTIMIWDTPVERRSMFGADQQPLTHLETALVHDLQQVFALYGHMHWSAPAIALYEAWWIEGGGEPEPQHKRLKLGYNGRRELQVTKIAVLNSLSESNDLIVEERHIARAIDQLLAAESQMQYIFNEMASAGSMMAIEDVIDRVRAVTAEGSALHEAELIQMLMQRFPSTQVHALVENLINSQVIHAAGGNNMRGFRKFVSGKKMAGV
jgi:hypothetical protein